MLSPLRPRKYVHGSLYRYHQGQIFKPGAEVEVLEMGFSLPMLALLGTCVLAGAPPAALAGPQVYIAPANHTSGIGGSIPFQFLRTQGLIDPNSEG